MGLNIQNTRSHLRFFTISLERSFTSKPKSRRFDFPGDGRMPGTRAHNNAKAVHVVILLDEDDPGADLKHVLSSLGIIATVIGYQPAYGDGHFMPVMQGLLPWMDDISVIDQISGEEMSVRPESVETLHHYSGHEPWKIAGVE